jgi:2-amino-4-hydroxy-6-hydroxymethyldihydropteridine diphosphokinase
MVMAFIGIGSNIEPGKNVLEAIKLLSERTQLLAISTIYQTHALTIDGSPDGPDYYNCVAKIDTELNPDDLRKSVLRKIERELGRVRVEDKYASRTIDLDILLYDDLVVREDGQRIPDPDIISRPFLSIPIAELAPDLVLPDSRMCISDLAREHAMNNMVPLLDFTEKVRREINGL